MGTFKPKFKAMPDDYFPISNRDIAIGVFLILFVILGVMGIMVGFMFQIIRYGDVTFVYGWAIILVVFLIVMLTWIYFGGKKKISA